MAKKSSGNRKGIIALVVCLVILVAILYTQRERLGLALVNGDSVVAEADKSNGCPSNLICTPVPTPPQPKGCPPGYTCVIRPAGVAVQISNQSAKLGTPLIINNQTVAYPVTFKFKISSNKDIILDKKAANMLSIKTTGVASFNLYENPTTVDPNTIAGDTSGYYVVLAGTGRTFTFDGDMRARNGNGEGGVAIKSVNYTTFDNQKAQKNINSGLDSLHVRATLNAVPEATSTIVTKLDNTSPIGGTRALSSTNKTENVVLARFDLKSTSQNSTLTALSAHINMSNVVPTTLGDLFDAAYLKVGDRTYIADWTKTGDIFVSNMIVGLPKDQYVPITIVATVNANTNHRFDGARVSVNLNANEDTVQAFISDLQVKTRVIPNNITSSVTTFVSDEATVSNTSASLGSPVVNSNTTIAYPVTFKYSIATGNSTLYVSKNSGVALVTNTTGYKDNSTANASTSLTDVTADPGTLAGDSSTYYVVPAMYLRLFTWTGTIKYEANNAGLKTYSITGIRYGTSSSSLTSNVINQGLENLKVTPVF